MTLLKGESMKVRSLVLIPAALIMSEIPPEMKIVNPTEPQLDKINEVKVVMITVHERGESVLTARAMLERVSGRSPISSLEDVNEILRRDGFPEDCDYLMTGVILRGQDGSEHVLYLDRPASKWLILTAPLDDEFENDCQILCYSPDK